MAARLLVEFGEAPETAVFRVRRARPGTVKNRVQEEYVAVCWGYGESHDSGATGNREPLGQVRDGWRLLSWLETSTGRSGVFRAFRYQ